MKQRPWLGVNWGDMTAVLIVAGVTVVLIWLSGCTCTINVTNAVPGLQLPVEEEPPAQSKANEPEKNSNYWL